MRADQEHLMLEDMRIVARALDVPYSAALANEQTLVQKDGQSSSTGVFEPQSTLGGKDGTS